MDASTQDIYEELKTIRENLSYIKENMVDKDMILTPEESKRIHESIADYKTGKKTSLQEFKKKNAKKCLI